jgi:hypothetical protein
MSAVLALEVSVCWRGWYRGGFCGGGLNDCQKGARHSRLAVLTRKRARRTGRKEENSQLPLGTLRWNLKAGRTVTEVEVMAFETRAGLGFRPASAGTSRKGCFRAGIPYFVLRGKTTKCRLFVVCIPALFSKFDASAR